jgi:LEA14-like dessication related protein
MKGLITIAIVGGVAYFLLKSGKQLQKLELANFDGNIDKDKTNLEKTTLKMSVDIYNPNTQNIPFKSIFADIYYNADRVTSINVTPKTAINLKARSTTKIPFSFSIKNLGLANNVLQFISDMIDNSRGTEVKTNLTVKGQLKADIFTIPIDETIDLAKKL